MDRGQTQTPQERFGSGREIKTSRASSLLCEDRAVYQRTLFFLSKQPSFYIIFVVVVVFVRLSGSIFFRRLGTRKTSARAARGIARENEARDYSARLLLPLRLLVR